MAERPREFVEPFAGGAIIGLTVAFEQLADHVTLIELDADVASVWREILNGQGALLAQRVLTFRMSLDNVKRVLASTPKTVRDRAFRTLLKNRVQHGGIMADGASLMNRGENGKGLSSRWYPRTLARRILDIVTVRRRITFLHSDGLTYLARNKDADYVWFIDPPYTVAGRRLYVHNQVDHEALFALVSELRGDFLMTYDNTHEVQTWADKFGLDTEPIPEGPAPVLLGCWRTGFRAAPVDTQYGAARRRRWTPENWPRACFPRRGRRSKMPPEKDLWR